MIFFFKLGNQEYRIVIKLNCSVCVILNLGANIQKCVSLWHARPGRYMDSNRAYYYACAYTNCQIHINFAIQFTKWNIVHIQDQCSFHSKEKQQKSVETEVYKCEMKQEETEKM